MVLSWPQGIESPGGWCGVVCARPLPTCASQVSPGLMPRVHGQPSQGNRPAQPQKDPMPADRARPPNHIQMKQANRNHGTFGGNQEHKREEAR